MPSAPPPIQETLRRLVLRLVLMVACVRRMAGQTRMGRKRMRRELAKAERAAALLADPDFWADPRTAGKAAEVARVVGDAGRRAMARRMIWPRRLRRRRAAAVLAVARDWSGRCRGGVGGWAAARVGARLHPSPGPLAPMGGEGFPQDMQDTGGRALPAAHSRARGTVDKPEVRAQIGAKATGRRR